jgi:hypothetical protein
MLYIIPLSASLTTLCKARWAQTFRYWQVTTEEFQKEGQTGCDSVCNMTPSIMCIMLEELKNILQLSQHCK